MNKRPVLRSCMKGLGWITLVLMLCAANTSWAQPCSGAPSFTVNLTGAPDSTWTSPGIARSGDCCGSSNPDRCIEFILTLDSMSSGIKLDIPSGALPGGALFYQIGCGTSYQVGTEICLSGPGPHRITFCKPGNNTNVYQIKAIPKPNIRGKLLINQACIGFLQATGLVDTSISWQSVPNNATYNSYLSCLHGCDSVSIIPTGSYPPTVTYRVCGQVQGGCAGTIFCDTATVRFVTDIDVDIQPKNATVCFGGTNATLTANAVGGLAPFHYTWSTGATTASINVTAGTYSVSMTDSLGCMIVRDTVVVTSFTLPIDANAGNDTVVCTRANRVSLNGVIQAAGGGRWSGGTGTFAPNDSTLNATYYPSVGETNAGVVNLKLLTIRNGTCPADSDVVQVLIKPTPVPVITGPISVCAYKTTTYSTNATMGNTYQWNATGGTIQGSATDTSVTVKWNAAGAGNISIKQINTSNCDSTVSRNITIQPTPAPVITGPATVCAYKTTTYTTNTSIGNTYQWNVTGGTIQGSATDTTISVKWNAAGAGSISLTQTNSATCDSTVSRSITIQPTPAPTISGPATVCAYKTSTYTTNTTTGNTYQWNVTGGTIQGSSTDTAITVKWDASGTGTISLKQTNSSNCDSTVTRNITIQPTPAPVITGPATVCAYKTTTYTANTTTGNTYQWNVTGGTIQGSSTDTTITVKWNASGTGTISLKQTNTSDCDSTISRTITIQPTPAPVITGPATVCAYKTTTYTTNTTTGNTYQWNVTGGTIQGSSTDTTITVKWDAAGSGSISLKQTNTATCDSTISRSITIQPTPAPVITGIATVCAYKTTTYTTNTTTGNTYQWNVTGGTIQGSSTDTTITVKWGASGTGTISLKQTNTSNCDSTISRTITIQPTPAPVITGPATVCAYKTTTYTTNTTTGNTYQWNVTGGTIQGSVTDTTITVTWDAAGAGTISLKQTNTSNCDSTISRTITIQTTPATVIMGPATVCAYKTTTYTTNTTSGNTYQWNVTGGTIQGSSTDTTITVKWNAAGAGTISLKQTNTATCDSTISRSITIQPTPAPVIAGPATVCAYKTTTYTTNTTTGNTYQWNVTGGTIQGSSTDTAITVKWDAAGAGTISLTQTNTSNCDSTVSRSITIQPTPAPVITGPATVCAYKTTTYTTNTTTGNTYQWNVTGGTIQGSSTDTAITVKWDAAGAGTISLTQTNTSNCDSTVSRSITIQPTPAPVITGPATVCAYKTTTYTTNTTTGNTYQWNVTGGTIQGSVTDTTITVTWDVAGAGTISLKQTNTSNCDSTVNRSITIQPTPAPVIAGPATVCAYKTTTYTTNTTTGNTYQWNITGGTIQGSVTDTTITVTWNASGTGTISLKQTNVSNCDSTISRSITIQSTPAPVITGPATVCAYKTTTYTTNTTTGNTYQWNVTGGTIQGSSTDTTITVKWNAAGAGTISLTQTNTATCDSTISRSITIQPTPAPVIAGPATVCAYKTTTYTTNTTTGNTYQWNVTGGTIQGSSTDTTFTVKWGASGTGTISLKQTNTSNCDSTISRSITIQPTPVPVITGIATVCAYKTTTYTTNTTTGNTYQWNVTGGTIQGSSTDTTITVKWGASGTGTISLKQTNTSNCDSTISRTITIQPTPAPVITGPATVCAYKTTTYTTNTTTGNTYQWNVTGGAIQGSVTDTTITVTWDAAGAGTISLKQTNTSNCDSTISRTITIQPTPAPVIMGPATVCAYKTTTYTTNTTTGNTYQWNVTGGTIQGSITDTTITVTWNASGTGTISLKQTNSSNCDSTVTRSITIQPTPAPVITGPATVCAYKTTTYTTNTTTGNTYQWNATGGTIQGSSTDTTITVKWNAAGSGSISLTQTNSATCDSTVSRSITIQPTPAPTIIGPATVCAYKTTTYTTNTTTGNTYQWNVTGGTIQGSSTDTTITVKWNASGTGTISLKQTNAAACDSTVSRSITIQPTPAPILTGPSLVCAFKTSTYSTHPTTGHTYQWTVTGGSIVGSATDTVVTIKWSIDGTGFISVRQTNTLGCDSIVGKTITIQALPLPAIFGLAQVCAHKQSTYNAGPGAGVTYQWTVTGGTIMGSATDPSVSVLWGSEGSGTVNLSEATSLNCDSTVSMAVTIQPSPAPAIVGLDSVCAYRQSSYSTHANIGSTYTWSVTGGTILGNNTDTVVSVNWSSAGMGNLRLVHRNLLGCDSTVDKPIRIQPTPEGIIYGPSASCDGKLATYRVTTAPGDTYSWTATGGVIQGSATDSVVTIRWSGSGPGVLGLTQVHASGCDTTVGMTVTILPKPVPHIQGPSVVCRYKPAVYTTNATVGTTYQWNVIGGAISGIPTDDTVTIVWDTAGIGIVTVIQTNSTECEAATSDTVTVQPSPKPVMSGPATVCAFQQSTYHAEAAPLDTYEWTVSGGTIQGSHTDTAITVQWFAAGNGLVTFKQTNAVGCDSTVSRSVVIHPKPVPLIYGPSSVCEHATTVFTSDSIAGNSYQWNVTGGTIIGSSTDTSVTIRWNNAGTATVWLTQQNAVTCDSTISRSIAIRPLPVPQLNGPAVACAYKQSTYTTNASAGNTYEWQVTGGVIQGATNDTIVTVKWNGPGSGSLVGKQINSFGCDSAISRVVTIQPTPEPVISGPAIVCANHTATYAARTEPTGTYQWTVTGGLIIGNTTDSIITVKWNGSGVGAVALKQTNGVGCDSTVSVAVSILALPIPVINGADTICAYQFGVFSTPVVPGWKYKWVVTGGMIAGSDTVSDISVFWQDAFVTNVALTVTNAGGCDSTLVRSIVVKNAPLPELTGDTLVCALGTYLYSANRVAGALYTWTVTGGTVVNAPADTAVRIQWGNAGTGEVRVLVGNPNGCDSLAVLPATIVNRVYSIISGPDTICERKVYTYRVAPVPGHTYLWSAAGGSIQGGANQSTVTIAWNTAGVKQLVLHEKSSADCDTLLMVDIVVKPTPTPVITGPATRCAYQRSVYTAPRVANDTYTWTVVGGVIESTIADTQILVRWNGPATGVVRLKQQNPEGCDSTAELSITLKPAPIPVITGPQTVCAYRNTTYTTAFVAGTVYAWTVTGGTMTLLHDTCIQVKWGAAGPGMITLNMIAPSTCDSTVTKGVTIHPTPNPDYVGPTLVCAHSAAVYGVLPQTGHTYQWTVVGGTIQGTATSASVSVRWGSGGTGMLTLQQQSAAGCDSLISKTIQVKARPVPVIQGPAISCAGPGSYTYRALPSGPYRYDWLVSSGTVLSGSGTQQIQVNWPQQGTFALSLQVTDTNTLCDSTVTLQVTVDSIVKPVINATALAGCVPLQITFSGNQNLPGYTYLWDFGNGNFSSNVNPEYVYTKPGTFTIKVHVSNSNGCKDSASAEVVVNYIPVADFSYEFQHDRIYAGEDTVKFVNKSSGGNLFLWELTANTTDTTVNPKNIYLYPGFYTVTLVTIDTATGCEHSTMKRLEVRVRERLYVPNAFTPDGDGINDYFHVSVTNIIEFEVLIFDRWGTILYQSNDPHFKWDGTYENNPVQADVYGFLITGKGYHGKLFNERGTVTVLR